MQKYAQYAARLLEVTKGCFFSESVMKFFQISKSQKEIFQKTILTLKFKFQAQYSFLEYFIFEIWGSE